MTKRVNKTKKATTTNVVDTKKVSSAIADKLKKLDYSKSNTIAKTISLITFLFASVRTAILAYVANDKTIQLVTNDSRIKLLRRSKKDSELYKTLRSLSVFTYKAIKQVDKNKITTINTLKSFNIKAVLNSCDVYLQISSVELTSQLINAIRHEHEMNAVNKCYEAIDKAQNVCNQLMSTIEHLNDAKLIEDYKELLSKAEVQLQNKVTLYDYVKIQSNRVNIK